MIDLAATRGVELLVLPELWPCGYDPATLADDARQAAEPRDGPRSKRLGEAALAADMWLVAGSVPESGDDGALYNTALVFNPRGELVAWHRKAHLYPPTGEPAIFRPGDRLTTFKDPTLGMVGIVICFDGDFPEVARTLGLRGARLVVAPSAYEVEGAADVGCPLPGIGVGQQPMVDPIEPVRCPRFDDIAGCQPDCGPHRYGRGGGDPGRPRVHASARTARAAHRPPAGLSEGRHRHPARGGPSAGPLR